MGDLGSSINDMRDAAIESTLSWLGYRGSVSTGFNGPNRITPLGGHYNGSMFEPGGRVTDPTGQYEATVTFGPEWPFQSLQAMVSYYNDAITDLFSDWWLIPQEGDFDPAASRLRSATETLATHTDLNPTSSGDTGGSGGSANPFGVNDDLTARVTTIMQQISQFRGAAMFEFSRNYANRIPAIMDSQDAVACFLLLAASGENEIWKRAHESLEKTAQQGVAAMRDADVSGGGDVSTTLTILGALASVAGVVPGIGTATGIALKLGSTALSTAAKFTPGAPTHPPLSAETPVGVIANLKSALDELAQQVSTEEGHLRDALIDVSNVIAVNTSSFDVATPPVYSDVDPGDFRAGDETAADWNVLLSIAQDDMPQVAAYVKDAARDVSGAGGSGPWTRPSGIGVGSTGCYHEFEMVRSRLEGLLDNSSLEIERAGEHLAIVARDFHKTDGEVRADLQTHATAIANAPS